MQASDQSSKVLMILDKFDAASVDLRCTFKPANEKLCFISTDQLLDDDGTVSAFIIARE